MVSKATIPGLGDLHTITMWLPSTKHLNGMTLQVILTQFIARLEVIKSHIWGFPKMVVPSNHGFSYWKWSFWGVLGVPPFKETPIQVGWIRPVNRWNLNQLILTIATITSSSTPYCWLVQKSGKLTSWGWLVVEIPLFTWFLAPMPGSLSHDLRGLSTHPR